MRVKTIAILLIAVIYSIAAAGSSDPDRFDTLIGTDWYGVYMGGGKVGYAQMAFEKRDGTSGWETRISMTMILNLMGQTDTIKISDTRLFSSPGGELYSNESKTMSPTGDLIVSGVKEADEYIITTDLGGQKTKKVLDYPVEYLDDIMKPQLLISVGEVGVGDSIKIANFEPTPPLTGLIHTNMKVESIDKYIFNGVPTDVYTVSFTIDELQFSGESIFDMTGRELETNLGGGMLLKLEGHELATMINQDFDFLSANLVRPKTKIKDPRELQSLTLKISGINEDDILTTEYQKVTPELGGVLRTEIKKADIPKTIVDIPVESAEMAPFLESTVYYQSDAKEIKELASEIIGSEKNSWEAAKKINQWVYDNIKKQFTPDFSNALQTLHTRQGDCGEHSALTIALLRAAGIPARPVTGLVYWPPGDGFGYHAWVEAYVGEWVMMDPSWGEDIVNPAHIALTTGDIVEQAGILYRTMGKMGIEVVEAK